MTPSGPRQWSSKFAFLAAAIGTAVGIANVWKFTYVAGENGGGAFVLVYLAAVLLIALPALIAELLVGRRGGASVVKTMDRLAEREGIRPAWRQYGQMAALGVFLALSFYTVVAGWTLDYFVQALATGFRDVDAAASAAGLERLMANPWRMMVSHAVFLGFTAFTVAAGVRAGLERVLNLLTPALFVILLVMLAWAVVAGDFAAGARFMFAPDFSRLDARTVMLAIGQAFFSIGIGLGMLLTVGAYMGREVSIPRAAMVVAGADTAAALLAGMAIFPIVFAHGLSPAEGPGLIFITLPVAFAQMPAGMLFGALFFVLLAIAALTSTIAAMETVVATAEDYTRWSRGRIVLVLSVLVWLAGLGTVFSFSTLADFHPLAFLPGFETRTIFESLDWLVSNLMMPLGGVLIAVLAGWGLSREATLSELGLADGLAYRTWRALVRWLVPTAIAVVFIINL